MSESTGLKRSTQSVSGNSKRDSQAETDENKERIITSHLHLEKTESTTFSEVKSRPLYKYNNRNTETAAPTTNKTTVFYNYDVIESNNDIVQIFDS